MSEGAPWDAAKVRPVAEAILKELADGVRRIEIAGSLRRGNAKVGDIEIVCVENFGEGRAEGLFGGPTRVSLLQPILDRLVTAGKIETQFNGKRQKKYRIATVKRPLYLDLFIVQPDGWGSQLAIRTGPAWLSRKMVTPRHMGGMLAGGYLCRFGAVWTARPDLPVPPGGLAPVDPPETFMAEDGVVYERFPVPEERDFMALLTCGYVEPEKRRNLQ